MKYIGKGLATLALAGVCCYWMHLNGGVSGIGWFVGGITILRVLV
jgi:hypothetical protein